jgi:two-component system nitrogen regulation response regulator NtrX
MVEHKNVKILVIDDEDSIREVLCEALRDEHYQVFSAQDGISGLKAIKDLQPDLVFLDIWMPGELDGLDVLKEAKAQFPMIDFVMISGHGTIETAVKATKLGAWDFIEKPLSMDKIYISVTNILNYQNEKIEKTALLNKLRRSIALIGESTPMVQLKKLIARVAATESWVLISGEKGTGKQLISQNIHYMSQRAGRPLVDVSCASIPEDLMAIELFGYEKGAIAGAERAKKGKFDMANGGTLFIDEVADLSLEIQSQLLQLLQNKTFLRVGGDSPVEVDVRVIAATVKDLNVEIKEGRFLEDLLHRLNTIPLVVPVLSQRDADIEALVSHFSDICSREGGFPLKTWSAKSLEVLKGHSWPGNVRELKNFIERIYILTPGEVIDVHDLKFAGLSASQANLDMGSSSENSLIGEGTEISTFREARAQFEKNYLLKMISENGGNISRTAEAIGLERSYLHRKIKSYGIDDSY